ncbi:MAG: sulfatase-like hydrolase/transferase [Bacteroidales bacterium]|nr:sulfatase-like hydrolase/transferase [Bacteroidales bacterium]
MIKRALCLLAVTPLAWSQYCTAAKIRNVVVILADDHARKVTGAYGNRLIRTPNIDRLAKEGVLFERAYCNSPISSASRASLLTGKYPHTTVSNLLFTPFDDDKNETIAEHLRKQGMETALIGKTHFNNFVWWDIYKNGLPDHGFNTTIENAQYQEYIREKGKKAIPDSIETYPKKPSSIPEQLNTRYLPEASYDADAQGTFFANRAAGFIAGHKDKPFFLWYAPHEPHQPYAFPVEYRNKYDPEDMPLPEGSDEDDRWIPEQFRGLTDEQRQGIIASYYTSTEYMDKNIGIVLDAIRENGLEDNTLIIYISDNGYLLYEHRRFEKHTMWEEATRQPLIVKAGNRFEKGVRTDALVEYVDIVPTILNILGKKPLKPVQGKSFLPVLEGKKTEHKKNIYSFYLEDNFAMVANKRWKYIFHTGNRDLGIGYATGYGPAGITHFLYNLDNDPGETTNLAKHPEYEKQFREMQQLLLQHFIENHPDAANLPRQLTDEGKLAWFCEPRDIGAIPSPDAIPVRIFTPK